MIRVLGRFQPGVKPRLISDSDNERLVVEGFGLWLTGSGFLAVVFGILQSFLLQCSIMQCHSNYSSILMPAMYPVFAFILLLASLLDEFQYLTSTANARLKAQRPTP